MHKFRCIKDCYFNGIFYNAGKVAQFSELPSRHFVPFGEVPEAPIVEKEVKKVVKKVIKKIKKSEE